MQLAAVMVQSKRIRVGACTVLGRSYIQDSIPSANMFFARCPSFLPTLMDSVALMVSEVIGTRCTTTSDCVSSSSATGPRAPDATARQSISPPSTRSLMSAVGVSPTSMSGTCGRGVSSASTTMSTSSGAGTRTRCIDRPHPASARPRSSRRVWISLSWRSDALEAVMSVGFSTLPPMTRSRTRPHHADPFGTELSEINTPGISLDLAVPCDGRRSPVGMV
ncbi:hypothetical protein FG87_32170 [Nocardia vulneris]|uniref:Uncharacterized protein n=1 Tax=Nocardia vulneris TaxID=1141657 RepID=A0ABR4Z7G8_9NOCA|nr:hypothetical protein FG87_32170 [Nocardia vulneris]